MVPSGARREGEAVRGGGRDSTSAQNRSEVGAAVAGRGRAVTSGPQLDPLPLPPHGPGDGRPDRAAAAAADELAGDRAPARRAGLDSDRHPASARPARRCARSSTGWGAAIPLPKTVAGLGGARADSIQHWNELPAV